MKTIFISHSSKDESRGMSLYNFLCKVVNDIPILKKDYTVFFAPLALQDVYNSDAEWKDRLCEELNKTKCFISLVTPNSLYSRWSNFEIGYISTREKEVNIIPISNIKDFDIDKTILGHLGTTVVRPMNRIGVTDDDAISNIELFLQRIFCDNKIVQTQKIRNKLKEQIAWWCTNNIESLKPFISDLSRRVVYVVGNEVKDSNQYIWNGDSIKQFVKELTNGVINEGLIAASSPRVEDVGEIVAMNAISVGEQYEIIGLYQIEQALPNKTDLSSLKLDSWKNAILRHRIEYLKRVDIYIIVGGNENTRDEFNAVTNYKHILVLPLPCFAGTGRKVGSAEIVRGRA